MKSYSDFKGTPSPWIKRVTKKGNQIQAVIPKRFGERVIEKAFTVGYISDDDCGVESCCCVEEHSNARLIANSPDLLEACFKLLNAVPVNTANGKEAYGFAKSIIDKIII